MVEAGTITVQGHVASDQAEMSDSREHGSNAYAMVEIQCALMVPSFTFPLLVCKLILLFLHYKLESFPSPLKPKLATHKGRLMLITCQACAFGSLHSVDAPLGNQHHLELFTAQRKRKAELRETYFLFRSQTGCGILQLRSAQILDS